MKPYVGGGKTYRLKIKRVLGETSETAQLVMMLQEEIVFTEYFRVYCLGQSG
jgi:hypothetical protein